MRALGLGLALALWAGAASAANAPLYQPPPAWVEPAKPPVPPPIRGSAPIRVVLQDIQTRLGGNGETASYSETAVQILSPLGLQAAGNMAFGWNPATATLIIHKLHLIRAGRTIDLLARGRKFTVLRRETNLERAMLDGTLTATFQPEGLQVGDILDLAMTIKSRDPVMGGHDQLITGSSRYLEIARLRIRTLWPADRPVRWRQQDGLPPARLARTKDGEELLVEANDLAPLTRPKDAPARYALLGLIDISDFPDWASVSAQIQPLFAKAEALAADSPLKAEAAKIRAASADPKVRAAMALHLVQDKVRYLDLDMNQGGYIPAAADLTWSRLFADCKGKTALLVALLHELGIEAEPALVNTVAGDGLNSRLPMFGLFDHAIVRAVIDGKVYWLDGTRLGDRDLDDISVPAWGWALPIQPAGATLERLVPAPLAKPTRDTQIRLDASGGIDKPAPVHAVAILRGDLAISTRLSFDAMSADARDRAARDYWRRRYDFIDVKRADATYDEATGEERLSMDGSARMAWTSPETGGQRHYEADGAVVGWNADFSRDPGPDSDAPFKVDYPSFDRTEESIVLPDAGKGFTVSGRDVDRALGGWELKRTSRIDHGEFTMVATSRSLVPEISFTQAQADQAGLRELANNTVYVMAPSSAGLGAGDRRRAVAPAAQGAAPDILGLVQQGYSLLGEGKPDEALAKFDKALAAAPSLPMLVAARGMVLMAEGRLDAAQAEFDKALALNPRDATALLSRGRLYAVKGEYALAIQELDLALAPQPDNVLVLLFRGLFHRYNQQPQLAMDDFDRALKIDPDNATALSYRGELRLQQGDVSAAMADFDQAIAKHPDQAQPLVSRSAIYLRWRRYQAALADLNRAVELEPHNTTALIQRGTVEAALKAFDKAFADFSQALLLDRSDPSLYYARAQAYYAKGDFDSALADVNRMMAIRPDDPGVLLARGSLYAAARRTDEAIKDFDASIALKPSVQAYMFRAQARPKAERAKALADIDLAVKLDPKASAPHRLLASLLAADGDRQGALRELDEALRVEPKDLDALVTRADIYGRMHMYDAGLKDLDDAVAADPENPVIRNSRCWLKATAGRDLPGALQDCNAAIANWPDFAAALDSRGLVELRLRRYDNSIQDYGRALSFRPEQAASLYGRGVAELRSGQTARGQADLAAARKASPGIDQEFAGYGVTP